MSRASDAAYMSDFDPNVAASIAAENTFQASQEFIVHECSECGYVEGESPQAGCCPKCGTRSDANPVKVRRV